jgi:hypothetical protein
MSSASSRLRTPTFQQWIRRRRFWLHIGTAKRFVGVVGAELCPEDFGIDGKDKLVVGFVVSAPARAETARTTPLTAIA